MRTVIEAPEIRADKKDLPPKNRVWGFRAPARHRIRKSASQVAESRRENAATATTIVLGRWSYLQPDPIGLDGGTNLYNGGTHVAMQRPMAAVSRPVRRHAAGSPGPQRPVRPAARARIATGPPSI